MKQSMRLQAGTYVTLELVKEISPYGYFLSNGRQEILLHYSEVEGEVRIGDQLEVFLYHDTEDRMAATMKRPLVELGEVACLEVVDIHPRMGCFLEMGLGRNLLLPVRELPEWDEGRPIVGDKVYIVLAHDRQGRMIAKAAQEKDLERLCFHAPETWKNLWVDARVYKSLQNGTFVVCDGGNVGFGVLGYIHETERTRPLRMGESIQVRVTFVREDGRVNLSMRQRKEMSRNEDAERIFQYLQERPNGSMPYSDETPADIIKQKFGISKSAFKRALGKLLKDGLIEQKGSWTHLKANLEQETSVPDHANR